MAQNALQVRIAGTGSLYLAPFGTAAPVDTATTLPAAWLEMGYTADKGVEMDYTPKYGDVMSWQSLTALRKFPQALNLDFVVELEQWNSFTIPLYFGNQVAPIANPSEAGGNTYGISNIPTVDERAAVIQVIDGTAKYRIYVPRCIATDRGKTSFSRTGAATFSIKLESMAVDANTNLATLIFKDGAYS